MAGRVCYVLFGLAAGARPHDSIDEELGTDASFSNVILPDFLRNLAVKESALDTALLQTPSGSEEICNAAAGAVKAVQAGTVRFADEFSSSCDFLSIKDEDCFSTSPLWTCKFSESGPNCHCRWTPTCHGVMKALPVSAGTHIVCLPMGNGCHCWGSLNCTSQLDYWTCAAFDHNSKEEKDLWVQRSLQAQLSPGKPAEKQTEADKKLGQGLDGLKKQALDMLHAGGCKCSAEARLVLSIPLSSAELSALSEESLAEFHVESQETATGQSVKNAVRETDSSGNDRVVLTITDKNQTGGSSTVPNKGVKTAKLDDKPTESESCVITGGQVKLDAWEKAAIFIMASPSILAVVLMVAINCFRVCFNSVSRRRSTENAVPAAEKPPLFFMVFCLFIEFISLLNVTSVLTTSHVAAAMFKDLEEQLGLPLSSLLLAAAPVGGSLGTVWTASFLMNRPSLVCTGTCLLIGVCNLIYALGLQVQSFSLLLATRFLGGFAGGATYFISVYFTRLSSRNSRTRIFGWYNFGMAAGLISGPVLASLLSTQEVERQLELFTSHNFEVGEACAYVVALISLSGAVLGSLYLPPNGEGLGVAELELELALRPVWWADDSMSAEKWIAHVCCSLTVGARMLCRQAWEAAAVMVLASHYCLGHALAGWGVSVGLLAYVVLQGVATQVTWVSDRNLVRCFQTVEILGVLLIHRIPRAVDDTLNEDVLEDDTVYWHIALFLVGSSLFYAGNCLGSAPIDSLCTKVGPRVECLMFYKMFSQWLFLGIGSFLARALTSRDPHQNVLMALLLPAAIAQFLVAEVFFCSVARAERDTQRADAAEETR